VSSTRTERYGFEYWRQRTGDGNEAHRLFSQTRHSVKRFRQHLMRLSRQVHVPHMVLWGFPPICVILPKNVIQLKRASSCMICGGLLAALVAGRLLLKRSVNHGDF
jgi:hypothetical protein